MSLLILDNRATAVRPCSVTCQIICGILNKPYIEDCVYMYLVKTESIFFLCSSELSFQTAPFSILDSKSFLCGSPPTSTTPTPDIKVNGHYLGFLVNFIAAQKNCNTRNVYNNNTIHSFRLFTLFHDHSRVNI